MLCIAICSPSAASEQAQHAKTSHHAVLRDHLLQLCIDYTDRYWYITCQFHVCIKSTVPLAWWSLWSTATNSIIIMPMYSRHGQITDTLGIRFT